MPHSQGLSNNSYPEPNQPNYPLPISSRSILILSSHLRLGLPKGLFPVGLPVKILKALLPSSILATCPAHLSLLDLITLTVLITYLPSRKNSFNVNRNTYIDSEFKIIRVFKLIRPIQYSTKKLYEICTTEDKKLDKRATAL